MSWLEELRQEGSLPYDENRDEPGYEEVEPASYDQAMEFIGRRMAALRRPQAAARPRFPRPGQAPQRHVPLPAMTNRDAAVGEALALQRQGVVVFNVGWGAQAANAPIPPVALGGPAVLRVAPNPDFIAGILSKITGKSINAAGYFHPGNGGLAVSLSASAAFIHLAGEPRHLAFINLLNHYAMIVPRIKFIANKNITNYSSLLNSINLHVVSAFPTFDYTTNTLNVGTFTKPDQQQDNILEGIFEKPLVLTPDRFLVFDPTSNYTGSAITTDTLFYQIVLENVTFRRLYDFAK